MVFRASAGGPSNGQGPSSDAAASRWSGGKLELIINGMPNLLQIRYIEGYDKPIIQLDKKVIGIVLGPGEGDALMSFLVFAAQMDPSELKMVPYEP
jgi:hypothetical protein